MAINTTNRKPNMTKRIRSHALNTTNSTQKLNLQVYRLENGKKVRMATKEKRTSLKNAKTA